MPAIDLKRLNYILAGFVILLGLCAIIVLAMPAPQKPDPQSAQTQEYSPPDADNAPGVILLQPHQVPALGDVLPDDKNEKNYIIQGEREDAARNFDIQQFDDWGLECVIVVNGKQECHLFQRVLWDDNGAEALLAHVLLVERDGKTTPRLRLIAPLGTYLPEGLLLKLGEEAEFSAPFQFCIGGGCFVNLDLADDVVAVIHKTEILNVAYKQPDGTFGRVEISLKGFEKGLKALEGL